MFKDFLQNAAIKQQLKQLPEEQREVFERLMREKPELLMQIAQEVKTAMDSGKGQMTAMQEVIADHQNELGNALSEK